MVSEIRYISIKRVLDNLLEHPLLRDLTLEQAVRHVVRFIAIHGYSKLYQDRIDKVDIHGFRGVLPCDLIRIIQVKDMKHHVCLRHMTDNFTPGLVPSTPHSPRPHQHLHLHRPGELTFKTQGRVIYTSFPEGCVEVAYKAIPVDEDGFPMLIDNEVYLGALEAYIKKQVFTVKFDTGKVPAAVLQNAQTDYAVLSKELQVEFSQPSVSEMEAITRMYNTLIPQVRHFDDGFREMGNREYLKRH